MTEKVIFVQRREKYGTCKSRAEHVSRENTKDKHTERGACLPYANSNEEVKMLEQSVKEGRTDHAAVFWQLCEL